MEDWKKIRKQFKAFDKDVYVNTAATGLIPNPTLKVVNDMYIEHAKRGAAVAEEWAVEMENIRSKVAKFINADDYEIAIVPNMTIGINWLAIMLKSSGHTISYPEGDYPSLITPWEAHGFKTKKIKTKKNGQFSYKQIAKEKTGILAVSHVQWHTGFKINLEELQQAKPKKQILILDATQSLGTCKIDVKKQNIDILMASCYKWMISGFGNCIMCIKKDLLNQYPSGYGWQYRASILGNDVFPSARRFELGHERHEAFFRLASSIDFINKIGIHKIEKRVNTLKDYLYQELKKNKIRIVSDYKKEHRSQIIIVEGDFATQKKLETKNIFTSFRGTGIRIALHFYNNKSDINLLVKALVELKAKKK